MSLSDPDARPTPGEVLCRLDEIPDGGALGLSYGSGVKRFKIVLFRRADALYAYVNECSHLTSPLELRPGQFLISEDGKVYCAAHGAGFRSNEGERRILLYRYGPGWGNNRYGYEPSAELIERLTPERRKIIQPKPPLMPPEYARGNHK